MLGPFVSQHKVVVVQVIALLDDVSILDGLRAAPREVAQTQSQPEAGPSKPTRSYIPVRAWPSSSVDLTSDEDAGQGPDKSLPRTPPQVPTAVADEPEELEVDPPSLHHNLRHSRPPKR
jgi:hypothetical protein